MAMSQQERDAKAAAKREAVGEEELRHRVRPGIRQKLADLMEWHEIEEIGEAVQLLILNAHAAGPEGSAPMLATPRHEIEISENVARNLREKSLAAIQKDPGDEVIAP
jgi:hypothetical protein